jgi:hypothetical protein
MGAQGAGGASGATGYLLRGSRSGWFFAFWKPLEEEMKEEFKLPSSYYLDESDPDILVLRRQDGSFVAAFSASGATKEGIRKAAMEDYQALIEAHGRRA